MSMEMMKKVGIVSYALTSYKSSNEMLGEELVFNVSKSVLDKAGITREEIDQVVIATTDTNDGITISLGPLVPAAGGYNSNKEGVRVETGGVCALISAYTSILAGSAECVVVASADAVEFDLHMISNFSYDPCIHRDIGINSTIASAILATNYMRKHGVTEEDYALVAAKNYATGALNPYAHIRKGYSVKEVLASPLVAWPLRMYECGTHSFGGAALLLASEERAKKLSDNPVWLTGCGMGSERYFGDWNEIVQMSALRSASQAAFKMAGIKNPIKDIDVAEVFNPFAPWELMEYEALGLCEEGKATKLLRGGIVSMDGALPVNVSGGTLCTNAPNSSGLFSTIQAVMYLKGELPKAKSDARRAVVCDSDVYLGVPGASYAVIVLERGIH